MKYSMFHSRGRKTDMHTRISYVSAGSLATPMLISADRNLHCLASLLVQQQFLGEKTNKQKEKLQEPLITLQTINQNSAKYRYWKASSYGCRFLCWDAIKDLARTARLRQAVVPTTGNWRGLWSRLLGSSSLWGGLKLPFTQTDAYRLPVAGADEQPPLFWEPLLQLRHWPTDGWHYLRAALSGSLCPRTTRGLAWETPSSPRSSR